MRIIQVGERLFTLMFQSNSLNCLDIFFPGIRTFSVGGTIVQENLNYEQIPDRLKVVFSNSITDDEWNFSYLHDCSSKDQNIFNDRTFKIEWPKVPSAFDDVTFGKWSFPRPGTSLKDNFILEGRIFGVYDATINCQDLEAKSGPNVRWNFVHRIPGSLQSGPNDEVAYADRYRIFYRRGSVDNQLASDRGHGNEKYLDVLRRYADDTGCEGCYGWKWFGCLADWIEQIPEGFSCAKAVASNKDGCKEVYQQVDCSDLVVKVSSRDYRTSSCSKKYPKRTCPTEFMDDQSLKNKKCHRMDKDGIYKWTKWENNRTWVVSSSSVEDLTCCSNPSQCCEDCFYEPSLGF